MREQGSVGDGAARVDVDRGHAGVDQLPRDAGPQVQRRRAGRCAGATARQPGFDVGRHLFGHFVMGSADRGAQQYRDVRCPRACGQHRLQRPQHDAIGCPHSSGVRRANHAGISVRHQHGHTIRGHHGKCQSRRRGDQSVGGVEGARAGSVDELDVITVHLIHPHHPLGRQSDRGGQPVAIGRHRRRVVADVVTEIEGVERRQ